MEADRAHAYARDWADAWNRRDVDAVLEHFADEVTFTSPVAARIVADSDGVIRGKAALRAYWHEGIRRVPDLHFEIVGVYVGIDTLTINYRNQDGGLVNEVLRFAGALVVEGHGTYLSEDA